jgi:hypothetical protein
MREIRALAITAVLAVSTIAGAQQGVCPPDPDYLTRGEARQLAVDRAGAVLRAGDLYIFNNLMQRAPYSVTNTLSHALATNYWQAYLLGEEMAATKKPSVVDVVVRIPSSDTSLRPMRLLMENRDMSVLQPTDVLNVLLTGLGRYDQTQLKDWWLNQATERERDVVGKIVRQNASMANRFYPSIAVW